MISRRALALAMPALSALLYGLSPVAAADEIIRVGVLGPAEQPRFSDLASGLRQGLEMRGYAPNSVRLITAPVARGDQAMTEAAIKQLRDQRVAVVFAVGSVVAKVARQVAPELPIVFITPGDPVASGLVVSLARPGNNITGVTFEYPELSGKRLELIRDLLGEGRRVQIIFDPRDASSRQGLVAVQKVAPMLGMSLVEREFSSASNIADVLPSLAGADALLVIPGGAPTAHYPALIGAANAARIATMFPARSDSTADALITYGAKDAEVAREAARLVERILKGASASEIPVERPTKLDLVVNLRTAKALGITIPPSILARADEVIE